MRSQLTLFGAEPAAPALPDGFKYQPEIISAAQEEELLERIRGLPFKEFEFHGFTGKRRTVSYGWKYSFADAKLYKSDDIPPFLLSLRDLAAQFAAVDARELQQVLVTEYGAGAAIGWHRDKAVFGDVIGISLLSAVPFRLRHKAGNRWERVTVTAEPRSAYLLRGPSRNDWEHSIPPVETLRYSVTFRNLRSILS
jgi:alkylated DNA repair dioxygenase AlkB